MWLLCHTTHSHLHFLHDKQRLQTPSPLWSYRCFRSGEVTVTLLNPFILSHCLICPPYPALCTVTQPNPTQPNPLSCSPSLVFYFSFTIFSPHLSLPTPIPYVSPSIQMLHQPGQPTDLALLRPNFQFHFPFKPGICTISIGSSQE
jgi:hypothetical protein